MGVIDISDGLFLLRCLFGSFPGGDCEDAAYVMIVPPSTWGIRSTYSATYLAMARKCRSHLVIALWIQAQINSLASLLTALSTTG